MDTARPYRTRMRLKRSHVMCGVQGLEVWGEGVRVRHLTRHRSDGRTLWNAEQATDKLPTELVPQSTADTCKYGRTSGDAEHQPPVRQGCRCGCAPTATPAGSPAVHRPPPRSPSTPPASTPSRRPPRPWIRISTSQRRSRRLRRLPGGRRLSARVRGSRPGRLGGRAAGVRQRGAPGGPARRPSASP